jgi:hypothetical protein
MIYSYTNEKNKAVEEHLTSEMKANLDEITSKNLETAGEAIGKMLFLRSITLFSCLLNPFSVEKMEADFDEELKSDKFKCATEIDISNYLIGENAREKRKKEQQDKANAAAGIKKKPKKVFDPLARKQVCSQLSVFNQKIIPGLKEQLSESQTLIQMKILHYNFSP